MYSETTTRSLIKAISWRVSATLATIAMVGVITGRLDIAITVGFLEVVVKFILYFMHERLWNKIQKGRYQVEVSNSDDYGVVIWFTGLPSSGKSTLAQGVEAELSLRGLQLEHLDGDAVREVFPGTGFSREDRDRHIRQMGFLASKLGKHGICVLASFVSPYRESRDFVRSICKNFIEVYVSTPLEECQRRDVKGLYKRARAGEIKNLTGVDDPYETPLHPEVELDTSVLNIQECVGQLVDYLKKKGLCTNLSDCSSE